jgi:uncharacterized repeat protein (TIGR02543 family)
LKKTRLVSRIKIFMIVAAIVFSLFPTAVLAQTHRVTFDPNGGTTPTGHAYRDVPHGTALTAMPQSPSRAGASAAMFMRWNNPDGSAFVQGTPITENITLRAQWGFHITFHPNEGTLTGANETYAFEGMSVAATPGYNWPSNPTRADHTFVGWFNSSFDGQGTQFTADTPVTAGVALFAHWAPRPRHNVTFMANGATHQTVAVPEGQTISATSGITMPTNPIHPSGYQFAGWHTDSAATFNSSGFFVATTRVDAPVTVHAIWRPTHVVTFNANGGTFAGGGTHQTRNAFEGRSLSASGANMPPDPTRNGFDFLRWEIQPGGGSFTSSTTVNGNMTVNAVWAEVFTVTFMTNHGTSVVHATRTARSGGMINNMPSHPHRENFSFVRWNTQPGGGGSDFEWSTTVSANLTVHAIWDPFVNVRFFDGVNAVPPIETRSLPRHGNVINMPTFPTRAEHVFMGWSSGFTWSTSVPADTDVTAQWQPFFTVTFFGNGESEPATATRNIAQGSSFSAMNNIWQNTGGAPNSNLYNLQNITGTPTGQDVFVSWNTVPGGTSATDFSSGTIVSGNINLYPRFAPPHVVTFNSNGAEHAVRNVRNVSPAVSIGTTNMPAFPVRGGFIFMGWHPASDGTGTRFLGTTTVNSTRDVHAFWLPQNLITFEPNGGEIDAENNSRAIPEGRTFEQMNTVWTSTGGAPSPNPYTAASFNTIRPTRENHNFLGWNLQPDGSGANFVSHGVNATVISENMIVYAQWEEIIVPQFVTVTFNFNGGTQTNVTHNVLLNSTIRATPSINMPSVSSRTGYDFHGWNTSPEGNGTVFTQDTAVDEDIEVYAIWNVRVTFDGNHRLVLQTGVGPFPLNPRQVITGMTFGQMVNHPNRPLHSEWPIMLENPPVGFWNWTQLTSPRANYVLLGWNTQPDYVEPSTPSTGTWFHRDTVVDAPITVYAQWVIGVVFNPGYAPWDSISSSNRSREVDIHVPNNALLENMPPNPVWHGQTFMNWNTNPDGSGRTYDADSNFPLTTVLYAVWNSTVTFDPNGGDFHGANPTASIVIGREMGQTFPAPPNGNERDFLGWNTERDGSGEIFTESTQVFQSLTLYAMWCTPIDLPCDCGDCNCPECVCNCAICNPIIPVPGGVVFSYGQGNFGFPVTITPQQGNTHNYGITFAKNFADSTVVFQWLLNGVPFGAQFGCDEITSPADLARLTIISTDVQHNGEWSLRADTYVNGVLTFIDYSRISTLTVVRGNTPVTGGGGGGSAPSGGGGLLGPPVPRLSPAPVPTPDEPDVWLGLAPPGEQLPITPPPHTAPPPAPMLPFDDICVTDWYYPFVRQAWENQLFAGTSADTFSPQSHMTRAMFVQVLANLEGAPLGSYAHGAPTFADTAQNEWYFAAVEWAAQQNITSGVGDGNFAPDRPVTREEMAVLLYAYINSRGIILPQYNATLFSDRENISPWATDAITALNAAGIFSGRDDGSFDPSAPATRAEVATIFAMLLQVT